MDRKTLRKLFLLVAVIFTMPVQAHENKTLRNVGIGATAMFGVGALTAGSLLAHRIITRARSNGQLARLQKMHRAQGLTAAQSTQRTRLLLQKQVAMHSPVLRNLVITTGATSAAVLTALVAWLLYQAPSHVPLPEDRGTPNTDSATNPTVVTTSGTGTPATGNTVSAGAPTNPLGDETASSGDAESVKTAELERELEQAEAELKALEDVDIAQSEDAEPVANVEDTKNPEQADSEEAESTGTPSSSALSTIQAGSDLGTPASPQASPEPRCSPKKVNQKAKLALRAVVLRQKIGNRKTSVTTTPPVGIGVPGTPRKKTKRPRRPRPPGPPPILASPVNPVGSSESSPQSSVKKKKRVEKHKKKGLKRPLPLGPPPRDDEQSPVVPETPAVQRAASPPVQAPELPHGSPDSRDLVRDAGAASPFELPEDKLPGPPSLFQPLAVASDAQDLPDDPRERITPLTEEALHAFLIQQREGAEPVADDGPRKRASSRWERVREAVTKHALMDDSRTVRTALTTHSRATVQKRLMSSGRKRYQRTGRTVASEAAHLRRNFFSAVKSSEQNSDDLLGKAIHKYADYCSRLMIKRATERQKIVTFNGPEEWYQAFPHPGDAIVIHLANRDTIVTHVHTEFKPIIKLIDKVFAPDGELNSFPVVLSNKKQDLSIGRKIKGIDIVGWSYQAKEIQRNARQRLYDYIVDQMLTKSTHDDDRGLDD